MTYIRPELDQGRSCRPPGRSPSPRPCRHRWTRPAGGSEAADVPGVRHPRRTRREVNGVMVSHWFVTIVSIVTLFVG